MLMADDKAALHCRFLSRRSVVHTAAVDRRADCERTERRSRSVCSRRADRSSPVADHVRELRLGFSHALMGAEADPLCGAGQDQRSDSRNGHRRRRFDTRAGSPELAIPKPSSYFLACLPERRKRAERPLTPLVATELAGRSGGVLHPAHGAGPHTFFAANTPSSWPRWRAVK